MDLKRITLVFENVEVVDIPAEQVNYLMMSGITETQFYHGAGEIENTLHCKECEIHIKKGAGDIPMEWSKLESGDPQLLIDRLHYRDIASVELDYGNHVESYIVTWPDGNELVNESMEVTDEGDEIRIAIG